MDLNLQRPCAPACRAPRRPLAAWLMLALIVAILGGVTVAAALVTDTRDVAARHGTVLPGRLL